MICCCAHVLINLLCCFVMSIITGYCYIHQSTVLSILFRCLQEFLLLQLFSDCIILLAQYFYGLNFSMHGLGTRLLYWKVGCGFYSLQVVQMLG